MRSGRVQEGWEEKKHGREKGGEKGYNASGTTTDSLFFIGEWQMKLLILN